jgi:hypothetical protein
MHLMKSERYTCKCLYSFHCLHPISLLKLQSLHTHMGIHIFILVFQPWFVNKSYKKWNQLLW